MKTEDRKITKVEFSPSPPASLVKFFRPESDRIQDKPIWANAAKHDSPLTNRGVHLD